MKIEVAVAGKIGVPLDTILFGATNIVDSFMRTTDLVKKTK
jgi:hypothetical protein